MHIFILIHFTVLKRRFYCYAGMACQQIRRQLTLKAEFVIIPNLERRGHVVAREVTLERPGWVSRQKVQGKHGKEP